MSMNNTAVKHKNIPIFIPHLGCPNMCVFCNQRSISGKQCFRRESVIEEIDAALATLPEDSDVEIAYFGGSFTGIDRDLMIYLLDVAKRYVDFPESGVAKITGIRMSTRPDYITDEIIGILSHYPVKTVELGLQSMDDEVLRLSGRGHSAEDAERACRSIKAAGYNLVGQMMIGLPGGNLDNELMTARKICEMGADGARIYPTVTFFGTELAEMAERGEYSMLSVDDAVYRSKEVLKVFRANSVDCIRIGLCASDNLMDRSLVKGGANHPALGELVIGELYYDEMRKLLLLEDKKLEVKGKNISIVVPSGETSKAIGQNGRNKNRLIEEFGMNKLKISESKLSLGVSVSIDE
jgi:histone acetyltransferase (RNA polymerase elongator complex component)